MQIPIQGLERTWIPFESHRDRVLTDSFLLGELRTGRTPSRQLPCPNSHHRAFYTLPRWAEGVRDRPRDGVWDTLLGFMGQDGPTTRPGASGRPSSPAGAGLGAVPTFILYFK